MERQPRLYAYVVEHDTGHAPNPYFDVCTLCRCKFRKSLYKPRNVVELAEEGDWIVGTGGANMRKSAGHGKLIYAMRVDEKLTRKKYYADPRFVKKRPLTSGSYAQKQGDNLRPLDDFEKHEQFALISRRFYYFGANAVWIPQRFAELEKKGPGFKNRFDALYITSFLRWLDKNCKLGKHGEPCQSEPKESRGCKSSC